MHRKLARSATVLTITAAAVGILATPALAEPHNECAREAKAQSAAQAGRIDALLKLQFNLQRAGLPVAPWLTEKINAEFYSLGRTDGIGSLCRDQ
jgi:hypothetical protein